MNLTLLPMSRSRTKREEPGDESAAESNHRYLLATIGLAAAVFLGRRWSSGDAGSATVSEQRTSGRGSNSSGLSQRMKALIVGAAVLALVRFVRRRRTRMPAR